MAHPTGKGNPNRNPAQASDYVVTRGRRLDAEALDADALPADALPADALPAGAIGRAAPGAEPSRR